jgi:hypothetical protein
VCFVLIVETRASARLPDHGSPARPRRSTTRTDVHPDRRLSPAEIANRLRHVYDGWNRAANLIRAALH